MPSRLPGVSKHPPHMVDGDAVSLTRYIIVKLTHRDMGPIARYLGPEIPKQRFIWQDPLPVVTYTPITTDDETKLKAQILAAEGLTVSNLVSVAWVRHRPSVVATSMVEQMVLVSLYNPNLPG